MHFPNSSFTHTPLDSPDLNNKRVSVMSENNTRPVLGDVTNRISKRGISQISQVSENCETLNSEDRKRVCVSVSASVCSEINSLKGNVISSISKVQAENKNPNVEVEEEQEIDSDNNVDLLSGLPESQESRSSGLEKCVGLVGWGSSDSNSGIDLIKSCSCSFCSKAAYMWTDLHYQDIKNRIAVSKKSQKEANILVQKNIREQGINSNKMSIVEFGLMGRFRSLFLHMEDVFGKECNQLEGSLMTLKDLRENCKTDLDSTNASSSGKQ